MNSYVAIGCLGGDGIGTHALILGLILGQTAYSFVSLSYGVCPDKKRYFSNKCSKYEEQTLYLRGEGALLPVRQALVLYPESDSVKNFR